MFRSSENGRNPFRAAGRLSMRRTMSANGVCRRTLLPGSRSRLVSTHAKAATPPRFGGRAFGSVTPRSWRI